MENIAGRIVFALKDTGLIKEELQEYYQYAIIGIMEFFVNLISILILSIVFKNTMQTIVFVIFFYSLRSRCGGYHMKTFKACYVCTLILYTAISSMVPVILQKLPLLLILTAAAGTYIIIVGVVNHPNMGMSREEVVECKRATRWMIILQLLCIGFEIWLNIQNVWIAYPSLAIILCGILAFAAKITGQEVKANE